MSRSLPKKALEFLDTLKKELNIAKPEDWYKVTEKDIFQRGGGATMRRYFNNSMYQAVKVLHPEFDWKPWKFALSADAFWREPSKTRDYFSWAADQLKLKDSPETWYKINVADINKLEESAKLLKRYDGSLSAAVTKIFPDTEWKPWRFLEKDEKDRAYVRFSALQSYLQEIFPKTEIKTEHFIGEGEAGAHVLDFYIPSLKLGFEVQGNAPPKKSATGVEKQREEKANKSKEQGITMIFIPQWWDRSISSLQATIAQHRPDIKVKAEGPAIPNSPPQGVDRMIEVETLTGKTITLPLGEFENITPGKCIDVRFTRVAVDGTPINPEIVSVKPNTTLTDLRYSYMKQFAEIRSSGFFIYKDTNSGPPPTCKGCYKQFHDRDELRIQTSILFLRHGFKYPNAVVVHMCANDACFRTAMKHHTTKNTLVQDYQNTVSFDPSMVSPEALPAMDVVEKWVPADFRMSLYD